MMNPRNVDFPDPGGPTMKVCPISPQRRLKRNGVEPVVAAYNSGGRVGGEKGPRLSSSGGPTRFTGSQVPELGLGRTTRLPMRPAHPARIPLPDPTALTA